MYFFSGGCCQISILLIVGCQYFYHFGILKWTYLPASRVTVLFVKRCIIFGCMFRDFASFARFLSQIVSLYLPNDMLCKRWRNTNDELVPGSFIFVPGFRDKKYQSKTKRGQMPIVSTKWTGIMNKFVTG
jgi:hypothetical protein